MVKHLRQSLVSGLSPAGIKESLLDFYMESSQKIFSMCKAVYFLTSRKDQ